jgi:FkbM family methyltransferase
MSSALNHSKPSPSLGKLRPLLARAQALLARQDFRRNPVRAIYRRLAWRLRWRLYPDKLWPLPAHGSFTLLTTRCEPGRYVYIQGASEPATARFIRAFLKPGMVFVDVGAHLGEYAILASALVAPSGAVHAFEPRPDLLAIMQKNLQLNRCQSVGVHPEAVWEETTVLSFELTREPSRSAVQVEAAGEPGNGTIRVRAVTLDDLFSGSTVARPNLIKIDVEGAELQVLRGSRSLLRLPREAAPVIVFEYQSRNTRRFGYLAAEIFEFLRDHGYRIHDNVRGSLVLLNETPVDSRISFERNLIASKLPVSVLLGSH